MNSRGRNRRMGNPTYQYILFDLDDTLYPKEAGVMKVLVERMQQFMVHRLGIPADDAAGLRQRYRRQYGTTLCGLMEEYRIDPHEFLAYVHDINLNDFMAASPPLNRMLTEIPLQKAIFTNADAAHARRVLDVLQVRRHFSAIIDIHAVQYKNKPNPLAYQHALAQLGTSGPACIMIEDTPRNLMPAKEVGMTTILVDGANAAQPPAMGIDFVVPTIFHAGKILQTLIPMEGPPHHTL